MKATTRLPYNKTLRTASTQYDQVCLKTTVLTIVVQNNGEHPLFLMRECE
ncbi:hypothetical protein [Shouchella lehensis]|nr:hypothetical protein [Shouchella lehensis]